jgi:hypothetical protein
MSSWRGFRASSANGKQITAEFLAYLAEPDQRQLFLDLGYAMGEGGRLA